MSEIYEKDFEEFVNNIFYNEPKEEYSIILAETSDVSVLFDKLVRIFNAAIKILYDIGEDFSGLENITLHDIVKITQYFKSFGIIIHFKICHESSVRNLNAFILNKTEEIVPEYNSILKLYPDIPVIDDVISPTVITSSCLSDRRLKIKTGDLYYFISFGQYIR
jgi:hypothetical protein